METSYEINNFEYNGFMGKTLPGKALYKAEFICWTNDPGIAKMKCSDGKTRLIPSFAIQKPFHDDIGKWVCPASQEKVLFGASSKS